MPISDSRYATNNVPEPVTRIAEVMSTFRPTWSLCGGWAVDAWLGRQTRDHGDIDISVFIQDQQAIFDHLAGWQLVAHDPSVDGDTSEPWTGRPLGLPGHIHGRIDASEELPDRVDAPSQQGFSLDIQLDDRSGEEWILSNEPRIAVPLTRCVRQSGWGLPTSVAEVLLFFKAKQPRPQDEADFLALLPHLSEEQRHWLWETIGIVHPGHAWLTRLSP